MGFGIIVSGWMQNLQEKAAEWDDWDQLVDRGWSALNCNGNLFISRCLLSFCTSLALLGIFLYVRKESTCLVLGPGHIIHSSEGC